MGSIDDARTVGTVSARAVRVVIVVAARDTRMGRRGYLLESGLVSTGNTEKKTYIQSVRRQRGYVYAGMAGQC